MKGKKVSWKRVLPSASPKNGSLHGTPHDLDRILAHYEEDFEMSSPIIIALVGEHSGKLRGKTAVGAYWAQALQSIPNLRFELLAALAGVNTITIYHRGHRGLAAEVLHLGPSGKVREAFA